VGVSADLSFDNDLTIASVGGVGPVRVATDPGNPFEAAVLTPVPLHAAVDSIGAVGPVTIKGIPDKFDINIDIKHIPELDIDIKHIPKIHIGLDPITINPVDLNIRLKEIPSVRAHLPADFNLGLSVLGWELLCLRLCGEAQIITEPYCPNPCEHCCPPREHDQNPDRPRHQEAP